MIPARPPVTAPWPRAESSGPFHIPPPSSLIYIRLCQKRAVLAPRGATGERGTHNPLVPGSSPGGPTISQRNHHLMASRARDSSPRVWGIAGASAATARVVSTCVIGAGHCSFIILQQPSFPLYLCYTRTVFVQYLIAAFR